MKVASAHVAVVFIVDVYGPLLRDRLNVDVIREGQPQWGGEGVLLAIPVDWAGTVTVVWLVLESLRLDSH
ncbi:hypothetical protein [Halorubrum laminariae]|uniref:Uncharacterized protein n=1 Tax=Halorubrum laminariae TaxID=1433523 RepID=A0ABD6BZ05_9EURY|nr:hypothetical protein [Halorubrum laminariae]